VKYTLREKLPIEAMQFTRETSLEVADWCGGAIARFTQYAPGTRDLEDRLILPGSTVQVAYLGDWVLRLGPDRFLPMSNEAFVSTYEESPE
jgi:hypothetical protein